MKKTEVELNYCELDLDYARTGWDSAYMVLYNVNELLKDNGINISFSLTVHEESELPDEFWNESNPNYNPTGIVIKEVDND